MLSKSDFDRKNDKKKG